MRSLFESIRFSYLPVFAFLVVPFLVSCSMQADSPIAPVTDLDGAPTAGPFASKTPTETGQTWRLEADGTGDFPTIQAAIDGVEPGDVILLAPGRYTWSREATGTGYGMLYVATWIDGITIRGEAGPEETILDCEGLGRHIYFMGRNNTMLVEGITFTGGNVVGEQLGGEKGGAIVLHMTSPTIRDCVFRDNVARWAGAVVTAGSCAATVEDCLFVNNSALEGGGAIGQFTSIPATTWRRCTIAYNTAGEEGGGFFAAFSPFHIEDCLIYGNIADIVGGGIWTYRIETLSTIRGSTIAENYSPTTTGVHVRHFSLVRMENTIVANGAGGAGLASEGNSVFEIGCSDIFGNNGGDTIPNEVIDLGGNLSLDPMFRGGLDDGDFALLPGSPCAARLGAGIGDCGLIGAVPTQAARVDD